MFGLI